MQMTIDQIAEGMKVMKQYTIMIQNYSYIRNSSENRHIFIKTDTDTHPYVMIDPRNLQHSFQQSLCKEFRSTHAHIIISNTVINYNTQTISSRKLCTNSKSIYNYYYLYIIFILGVLRVYAHNARYAVMIDKL